MFASCTMSHSPPKPPLLHPDPLMLLINWSLTAIRTVCAISISKITDSKQSLGNVVSLFLQVSSHWVFLIYY